MAAYLIAEHIITDTANPPTVLSAPTKSGGAPTSPI